MKKKAIIIFIILGISFLTTACWDMVEINQRIFPYSIGIDKNEGEDGKYLVTISYLNINAIGKNATQKDMVFVVSTNATSIFQAARKLSTSIPYPFYFKHLRVILIGEELAKDGHQVRQIMDGMSRDFIINKKIQIVMAQGKAHDILEHIPQSTKQERIEGTLFSLLKDGKTANRFTSKTLTDFIQNTGEGRTAMVPITKVEDKEIKVFGGAIFEDYCFIGTINEIENRAISFIRNMVKSELIDAPYDGSIVSYSIIGQDVNQKLLKENNNLVIELDIEIEGSLQEYIIKDNNDKTSKSEDLKTIEEMEEAINKELKKEMDRVVYLLQKEYKTDAIHIGEYIAKFHPKVWKEVEKDWKEIFPEIEIRINVDSKIRRRGLIK